MPVQCTCPTCGAVFFRTPTKRKRYCSPACRPNSTDLERFWSRVDKTGECWLWDHPSADGYGDFRAEGRSWGAHVYAYTKHVADVPSDMTLDHLCRVRHCVNYHHLEVVTRAENVLRGDGYPGVNARKTHCPQGHPYDNLNTMWASQGRRRAPGRRCRICRTAFYAARYQRRKLSATNT
jgi:hypothetical protein